MLIRFCLYELQAQNGCFLCFVGDRRAFDTVRHEELFYKLHCNGISDRFYNAVKNMYQNIDLCVKVNPQYFFHSHIGVRQGDNLSPTFSNYF